MYAVKGRGWRAVAPGDELEDGEQLCANIPADAMAADQVAESKFRISLWLDRPRGRSVSN
ncbi:hypothetical protein [Xanthomonas citri]|uniref:hypothetical protein n=1 Tax=Xanthomonas citri TaxID=346 RepID=UPI0013F1719B|nr:hypothetical protein [Xanthomonas citri]MCC8492276.1 hypothetical protein [Xanthomonas citri pv. fuscans]